MNTRYINHIDKANSAVSNFLCNFSEFETTDKETIKFLKATFNGWTKMLNQREKQLKEKNNILI